MQIHKRLLYITSLILLVGAFLAVSHLVSARGTITNTPLNILVPANMQIQGALFVEQVVTAAKDARVGDLVISGELLYEEENPVHVCDRRDDASNCATDILTISQGVVAVDSEHSAVAVNEISTPTIDFSSFANDEIVAEAPFRVNCISTIDGAECADGQVLSSSVAANTISSTGNALQINAQLEAPSLRIPDLSGQNVCVLQDRNSSCPVGYRDGTDIDGWESGTPYPALFYLFEANNANPYGPFTANVNLQGTPINDNIVSINVYGGTTSCVSAYQNVDLTGFLGTYCGGSDPFGGNNHVIGSPAAPSTASLFVYQPPTDRIPIDVTDALVDANVKACCKVDVAWSSPPTEPVTIIITEDKTQLSRTDNSPFLYNYGGNFRDKRAKFRVRVDGIDVGIFDENRDRVTIDLPLNSSVQHAIDIQFEENRYNHDFTVGGWSEADHSLATNYTVQVVGGTMTSGQVITENNTDCQSACWLVDLLNDGSPPACWGISQGTCTAVASASSGRLTGPNTGRDFFSNHSIPSGSEGHNIHFFTYP